MGNVVNFVDTRHHAPLFKSSNMVKRKRGEGEADVAVMAPTAGVNGHSWKEKATATNGFVKGKFAKKSEVAAAPAEEEGDAVI